MRLQEQADRVVIEPEAPARAAVIWLHGLGADGHDFVPVVAELGLPATAAVRFVFPHAPVRPVTLNNGLPMRAWYDITGLNRRGLGDRAGLDASQARVEALIAEQAQQGIPSTRVVIAGFSQGGALALHAGLRHAAPLAGLLPLSTYLPFADRLAEEANPANRAVTILMCHGQYDPVLPYALGEESCGQLRALGYAVDWAAYPMQHQVCLEQIQRIGGWLTQRLAGA